jgi:hypothetical protein
MLLANWVKSRGGMDYGPPKSWLVRRTTREAPTPQYFTEADLALYVVPPARALSDRLISVESATELGILWDADNRSLYLAGA